MENTAILYKMLHENQLSKNKYKKQTLRRDEFNLRDTCKARIFKRYKVEEK